MIRLPLLDVEHQKYSIAQQLELANCEESRNSSRQSISSISSKEPSLGALYPLGLAVGSHRASYREKVKHDNASYRQILASVAAMPRTRRLAVTFDEGVTPKF